MTSGFTLDQVLGELHRLADPEKIEFKRRKYGIATTNSLGIYHKDLKELAKKIGPNDQLALQLYDTGIYEARLLCSKVYKPENISKAQMNEWVKCFDNWEICDSFCMGFFSKSEFAIDKAHQWSKHNKEFVKRAGFTIMASYGFANKKASNDVFEAFYPAIEREACDERQYVKKAVNWALRSIGKRNQDLLKQSVEVAQRLVKIDNKTAQWIAKDALRELQSPRVNVQDYPRSVYRST